jgi:DNA-directed RNA polymerase subunit RPC12/RpoP
MALSQKEIFIRFKEGEREAEMSFSDTQPEYQLALIDGIFKFFDINVDFKQMAEVDIRTRQAYQDFFLRTNTTSFTETNEVPPKKAVTEIEQTIEEVAAGYQEGTPIKDETPDYYVTGIKEKNGKQFYRCRFVCPKCKKKANNYILPTDRYTECHECYHRMTVKSAADRPLERDVYGNFYIAGDFQKHIPKKEDLE